MDRVAIHLRTGTPNHDRPARMTTWTKCLADAEVRKYVTVRSAVPWLATERPLTERDSAPVSAAPHVGVTNTLRVAFARGGGHVQSVSVAQALAAFGD